MGPDRGVFAACGSPQPPTGGLFGTAPPPHEVAAMQQPLSSAAPPSEMFGQSSHPNEVAATGQKAGAMSQGQHYAPGPAIAPTVVPQSFAAYPAPETPLGISAGIANRDW